MRVIEEKTSEDNYRCSKCNAVVVWQVVELDDGNVANRIVCGCGTWQGKAVKPEPPQSVVPQK
jgi:hypothetical protein